MKKQNKKDLKLKKWLRQGGRDISRNDNLLG